MIRYFLLLIISSSILFTQELNDKWLNTVLEKNVPDMVATPTEALNKQEKHIKIETSSSLQREAILDMLKNRSISRKVSIKIFDFKEEEKASGMTVRQFIHLKEGISKDDAKIINTLIKNFKLKVQSQIQGEQIRVTAKKIDDLQDIIGRLKEEKLSIALQYINFKK